ncbi:inorganic phosphate transporter, partial [Methanocorpusculum sp.]|nr:inorganic phosphate transporter [Methanocorpusculum sp.]
MDVLSTVLVVAGIVIALAFNFSNGRNDASNTIATVVATHALSPRKAIIIASICCFLGPFVFSTAVAKTIGKGIVNPEFLTPLILFIGLCGAVLWVNICSNYGIPVSSSHSLVGGLLGVGLAAGGAAYINWPTAEMFFEMLKYLGIGVVIGILVGILLAVLCKDKIRSMALLGGFVGFVLAVPV